MEFIGGMSWAKELKKQDQVSFFYHCVTLWCGGHFDGLHRWCVIVSLDLAWSFVTQREQMRLFEGDIKTDILK